MKTNSLLFILKILRLPCAGGSDNGRDGEVGRTSLMNNDFVMIGNSFFMPHSTFMHAICKFFNGNRLDTRNQERE